MCYKLLLCKNETSIENGKKCILLLEKAFLFFFAVLWKKIERVCTKQIN